MYTSGRRCILNFIRVPIRLALPLYLFTRRAEHLITELDSYLTKLLAPSHSHGHLSHGTENKMTEESFHHANRYSRQCLSPGRFVQGPDMEQALAIG